MTKIPSPDLDPARITALMAELPRAERNALIGLFDRWLGTPKPRRACLAKILWPELRDEEVAVLAGVCRRQLLRYEEYRGIKPTLADFKLSRTRSETTARRRGFSSPDDPRA